MEDSGDEDEDIVNVDFDFFSPKEIDFHSTKNLLRQLFGPDSILFDLSTLSDLIISQSDLGSTIKTDGENSDPLAILTAINLKDQSKAQSVKKGLIDYFIQKTQDYATFNRKIRQICSPGSKDRVGIIFSERLINMPTELMPPMYKMLLEEMKNSASLTDTSKSTSDASSKKEEKEEKEGENDTKTDSIKEKPSGSHSFDFDYIFIVSKTFQEEESQLDKEERISAKKSRRAPPGGRGGSSKKQTFFFHPEDEVIHNHALYFHSYKYSKEPQSSDSKRAFYDYGIFPQGHLILLDSKKMPELVEELEVKIPPF